MFKAIIEAHHTMWNTAKEANRLFFDKDSLFHDMDRYLTYIYRPAQLKFDKWNVRHEKEYWAEFAAYAKIDHEAGTVFLPNEEDIPF